MLQMISSHDWRFGFMMLAITPWLPGWGGLDRARRSTSHLTARVDLPGMNRRASPPRFQATFD